MLNLILSTNLISQIYVSELFDNEIILGPDNINEYETLIAPFYIAGLSDMKMALVEAMDEELNVIEEFKNKEPVKKREKKALKRAKKTKRIFDAEIHKIDSIQHLWNELVMFQESLMEASEIIKEGKCIEFTTKRGKKFYSDEIQVEVEKYDKELNYQEIIPVKGVAAGTKWVKQKADRNCLSADPNDCLVWCLIEEKGSINFKDITGKEFKYNYCPDGFEYDEENGECYKEMTYTDEYDNTEVVSLIRNRSQERLIAKDWKIIKCD